REPPVRARFVALGGPVPPRARAWAAPALAGDPQTRAFREQLQRVAPAPKVPEWEQIAAQIWQSLEPAIRGHESVDDALKELDARVDQILEKRRSLQARSPRAPH